MSDLTYSRTLAAVLAADIAGYSRLMQQDEDATMAAWWSYRREIVDPAVAANLGRIVKLTGDGFLVEFSSVASAVAAAVRIQAEIAQRLIGVPVQERVEFRIGINLGDILKDDKDIYGDGVNLAARIEALAEPGGIWVSSSVYEQVRNRNEFALEDAGLHNVNTISQPVQTWRVKMDHQAEETKPQTESAVGEMAGAGTVPGVVFQSSEQQGKLAETNARPSIVVLPFNNLGNDPEQDYFADGMTEDLITELSRFQELLVIARNTAFTFKNRQVKTQEIASELNIRYVLEGSVRRAGNRVRIAAQLGDGASGHHIWAERFDRNLEDVFAVQDEGVQKIVAMMSGKLVETERNRSRTMDGDGAAAYDLVLKGRELWQKFTAEDNRAARALYQQALELDPTYGRACASIAWTYMMEASERWSDDPQSSLDKALEAARQAVQIKPDSHTNHGALGQVFLAKKMHTEAIEAYRRTIALNPNDPDGYMLYGRTLAYAGKFEEAAKQMAIGREMIDTAPGWYHWFSGTINFLTCQYEAAIEAMRASQSPGSGTLRWLAICYAMTDQMEEATAAANEYLRRQPNYDFEFQLSTEPFAREEDRNHYIEAMTKAGLGPKNPE
ncbi:MAG: tetratricopeptide repeat protein [Alphaproteobacteria bacterium]|nr:tetratricopeptide repeat protein [Alphaproteobacteria bacterium]